MRCDLNSVRPGSSAPRLLCSFSDFSQLCCRDRSEAVSVLCIVHDTDIQEAMPSCQHVCKSACRTTRMPYANMTTCFHVHLRRVVLSARLGGRWAIPLHVDLSGLAAHGVGIVPCLHPQQHFHVHAKRLSIRSAISGERKRCRSRSRRGRHDARPTLPPLRSRSSLARSEFRRG